MGVALQAALASSSGWGPALRDKKDRKNWRI